MHILVDNQIDSKFSRLNQGGEKFAAGQDGAVKSSDFDDLLARVRDGDFDKAVAAPVEDDGGFSVSDLLDIVNPLHHIPVVKQVYSAVTGDEIRPELSLIGGALYGGAVGALMPLANLISEEETGESLGEKAFSMLSGRGDAEADGQDDLVMLSFADLGQDTIPDIEPEIAPNPDQSLKNRARYAHENQSRYND